MSSYAPPYWLEVSLEKLEHNFCFGTHGNQTRIHPWFMCCWKNELQNTIIIVIVIIIFVGGCLWEGLEILVIMGLSNEWYEKSIG